MQQPLGIYSFGASRTRQPFLAGFPAATVGQRLGSCCRITNGGFCTDRTSSFLVAVYGIAHVLKRTLLQQVKCYYYVETPRSTRTFTL